MSVLYIRNKDGNFIPIPTIRGLNGKDGKDYILTDIDKQEIANIIKNEYETELLEILGGDENVAE